MATAAEASAAAAAEASAAAAGEAHLQLRDAVAAALHNSPSLLVAQENIPQARIGRDRAFALISPTARIGAQWRLNDREVSFDFADQFSDGSAGDAFSGLYSNLGFIYGTLFDEELIGFEDCDELATINGYGDCAELTAALEGGAIGTDPSEPSDDEGSTVTVIQPKQQGFLSADVSWPLSPRVVSMGRAGQAQVEASKLELLDTSSRVILQVVDAFSRSYQAQESLSVLTAQAELAIHHLRDTRLMRDAGLLTEDAVLRARLEQARIEGQVSDLQRQAGTARRALSLVMGVDISDETSLAAPPTVEIADPAGNAGWQEAAIDERADTAAAEARARVARHLQTDAALQFLPSFSLTGNWNWTDQASGFDAQQSSWWFGIGASLPVWDGGLLIQNAREAASRKRQAEHQAKWVRRQAATSVADARDAWQTAGEAVPIAELERELAAESHRLLDLRYREGEARQLELLDGLNVLQTAQLSLLRRQVGLHVASVRLLAALGDLEQWVQGLLKGHDQ